MSAIGTMRTFQPLGQKQTGAVHPRCPLSAKSGHQAAFKFAPANAG